MLYGNLLSKGGLSYAFQQHNAYSADTSPYRRGKRQHHPTASFARPSFYGNLSLVWLRVLFLRQTKIRPYRLARADFVVFACFRGLAYLNPFSVKFSDEMNILRLYFYGKKKTEENQSPLKE